MGCTQRKMYLVIVMLGLLLFINNSVLAQVNFPQATGHVNDFASVFDNRSKAEMEVVANQLKNEQGIELVVVTINSTAPLDPKSYTTTLFAEWGIGGSEDSGILILLALSERQIEVEPGYGLEGALPDGKIGALIDNHAMEYLAAGQYGRGISMLAQALQAELTGEEFATTDDGLSEESRDWFVAFFIFAMIVFLMRRNRNYPPGGGTGTSGRSRPTVIFGPRFPGSGGRGGFGGGRGGGFGGFGGGRSGGGGAGRRF